MNAFFLTPTEMIARARADLRMGAPVLLAGAQGRMLVLAAEALSDARFDAMRALPGDNPVVLTITARRAQTLKARVYDEDIARIAIPAEASTTWVRGVVEPAKDLEMPMKGPFQCLREGSATLARIAVHLAKDAHLLPAVVMRAVDEAFAVPDLTVLNADQIGAHLGTSVPLHPLISARVPLESHRGGKVHVFRPEDGGEEHYAIEIGTPPRDKPVLARLHSACFTGDVLGSLKCDCGPQLRGALAQMGSEGAGVLLYLNQEGRGIGLANKMRAYALQDQGFDTVDANHRLGFEDDERDFRIGAELLRRMGFASVRLMTNNPAKIAMLETNGVQVAERVPLKLGLTPQNAGYLATKAARSGHLL